ncbi:MAG: hypothetical protein KDC87_17265, partial [Planctomycetes bacterium]|nr:hypothetical protein [Planctomycetota bacterium]
MGISRTLTSGPGPSRIVPGVDHRARLIRKLFLASQDQDLRQRFATYERVAASTGVRERVEGLLRCSHRARAAIPTPQPRTAVQQLDALIVRRGARLGRYRISRHLARGGMGDV